MAKTKKKTEGTGGDFTYCELGKSLFDKNQLLNEEVALNKILEYVWYSETKSPYQETEEDFLLGKGGYGLLLLLHQRGNNHIGYGFSKAHQNQGRPIYHLCGQLFARQKTTG